MSLSVQLCPAVNARNSRGRDANDFECPNAIGSEVDAIPVADAILDRLRICTLHTFPDHPCSPHLASYLSNVLLHDDDLIKSIETSLEKMTVAIGAVSSTLIETAGGVMSPSTCFNSRTDEGGLPLPLNGVRPIKFRSSETSSANFYYSLQKDTYSSLNLPVLMIADPKLGGISVTLSSLESLLHRGYFIDGVVFLGGGHGGEMMDNHGEHIKRERKKQQKNILFLCSTILYSNSRHVGATGSIADYLSSKAAESEILNDQLEKAAVFSLPPPPEQGDLWEYYDDSETLKVLRAINSHLKG